MLRPALVVVCLATASCLPQDLKDKLQLPPSLDVAILPAVQGAQRLLIESGPARLELDPSAKDAITALGQCADLVTYCYSPPERELADCMVQVKTCQTATPWGEDACCPQACKDAYAQKVSGGTEPLAALEDVLFNQPDCFPGVRAALEHP